jgi:hypothetical protein
MADSEEFDTGDLADEAGRPENPDIKQLRAKAKRHDALSEEVADLKRQLALTRAGLDGLDERKLKALTSVHEGEFDADSLKATAESLGFIQQSTPTQEGQEAGQQDQPDPELAAIERMSDAMTGTSTGGPDPEAGLRKKINEAQTPEELDAILAQAGMLRQY